MTARSARQIPAVRLVLAAALAAVLVAAAGRETLAQDFVYDTPDTLVAGQPLGDSESYEPSVVSRADALWLTWLQFVPGEGDHIWVGRRGPAGWLDMEAITTTPGTYAKPTLTVDTSGTLWLSYEDWDETIERWDVVQREHQDGYLFLPPVRVNNGSGNAINHSVSPAPGGGLWFAWQEDRLGQFDIVVRRMDGSCGFCDPEQIVSDNPNFGDWHPSIQATSSTSICVAWDSYDGESYDVLARWLRGQAWGSIVDVATGPAFQARVHLAVRRGGPLPGDMNCDGGVDLDDAAPFVLALIDPDGYADQYPDCDAALADMNSDGLANGNDIQDFVLSALKPGSVWCVWEQGGINWGKDYRGASAGNYNNITDDYGPLHRFRTLHLAQLSDDGSILLPAAPLPLPGTSGAINRSNKRSGVDLLGLYYERGELLVDDSGRPWVFYRHFYAPWTGQTPSMPHHIENGWQVHGRYLDGSGWSELYGLNVMQRDGMQKLALVQHDQDIVAAWTVGRTDRRSPSSQRGVYIAYIPMGRSGSAGDPILTPAPTAKPPKQAKRETHRHSLVSGGTAPMRDGHELVFGDLHRHTDLSLCFNFYDGTLDDAYRSAIDAGGLDFFGVTDHSRDIAQGNVLSHVWWRTIKAVTRHRLSGTFFPYFSFERSDSDTDHNVISLRDDMLRSHVPQLPTFWAEMDGDTFTMPHTTGNAAGNHLTGRIWNWHDDEKRPLLEIFQGCRNVNNRSETSEGLDLGYHFGFVASSDHMSNHTSYACVWTPQRDREPIFRSMQARRTYGATDRILLVFKSGDHWMGERITAASPAPFTIEITGTGLIDRVDFYRDGQILNTFNIGGAASTFNTTVNVGVPPGGEHYYYIHVIQVDGHEAWASPIWVSSWSCEPRRPRSRSSSCWW